MNTFDMFKKPVLVLIFSLFLVQVLKAQKKGAVPCNAVIEQGIAVVSSDGNYLVEKGYTTECVVDFDGDGVLDDVDNCPEVVGLAALGGCPDADSDGVADKDDTCPDEAGVAALSGCPDTDGDGIANAEDSCPEVAGLAALAGCPDTDGDGIANAEDTCPEVAGLAALGGCPDTDGDGVADNEDGCPEVAGTAALKGCPDSDEDGVADVDDHCPDEPGLAVNAGCPEVSEEVKEVLAEALEGVKFQSGKDVITRSSYAILDKVEEAMLANESLHLKISGHTDNTGDHDMNLKLSEKRAQAVKKYLVDHGMTADRIEAKGYGDTQPIEDNSTAEGRKHNRRVEFEIVY